MTGREKKQNQNPALLQAFDSEHVTRNGALELQ